MTPEITKGIEQEITAIAWDILTNTSRPVDVFTLEKYNRRQDVSTTANFVVISFDPNTDDSQMMMGGLTKMCFTLGINVYCYFDDQAISNDLDVSLSYIEDFDFIRDTFNLRTLTRSWETESMLAVKTDFGFTAGYMGVKDADILPDLTNTKGFKLVYDCTALGVNTLAYTTITTGTNVTSVPTLIMQ